MTAPATNPSCTAIVSQAAPVEPRSQSARSCGTTAEAENHVVIPRMTAPESSASARQRPGAMERKITTGWAVSGERPPTSRLGAYVKRTVSECTVPSSSEIDSLRHVLRQLDWEFHEYVYVLLE